MEAQGLKMKAIFKKDAVPTRDSVVPPVLQELSARSKRQVRKIFAYVHVFVTPVGNY